MFENMLPKNFTCASIHFGIIGGDTLAMMSELLNPLQVKYGGEYELSTHEEGKYKLILRLTPRPVQREDCSEELFAFLDLNYNYPQGMEHLIRLEDMTFETSSTSDIEAKLISGMVKALDSYRSAIIGCYAVANGCAQQVKALEAQVKSLTIYNHEVVNNGSVQQAIMRVAKHAGMDPDDLFPTTYHKVH